MASYVFPAGVPVTVYNSTTGNFSNLGSTQLTTTFTDNTPTDTEFSTSEALIMSVGPNDFGATYTGILTVGTTDHLVFTVNIGGGQFWVMGGDVSATHPTVFSMSFNGSNFTVCFAEGTRILTPRGETAVEALVNGDIVRTADGRDVPVLWVGRQTVRPLFSGAKAQPVCIKAGALGGGLPHSDLTVTADHAMIVDGYAINASALVNGDTIDWVPLSELPDSFVVYHVETPAHEELVANGAPTESFVDVADRKNFDNYAEYVAMYGADRMIPEMNRPRITSPRLLPARFKTSNAGPLGPFAKSA